MCEDNDHQDYNNNYLSMKKQVKNAFMKNVHKSYEEIYEFYNL